MRIRILYTGGTIGMTQTPRGLAPGADLREWLAKCIGPELPGDVELSCADLEPLIDSSNATPKSWQAIIDALWAARDEASAFVVLHGTDTMAYTAAAVSYALTGFGKPVVFTGAQLPLGAEGSDAAGNARGAIHAACGAPEHDVSLFFGHRLFQGNRTTKDSSWAFGAFRCPNGPASGGCGWDKPKPYTRHDIALVDLAPGTSPERLERALAPLPEAVLLRAYGVGNIPADEPEFPALIERLRAAKVPLIVCSQCPQARVELGRYETGSALARLGAVGAGDMTFEAAYAKTVFLLSQGLTGTELAAWIPRSIAGEIAEEAAMWAMPKPRSSRSAGERSSSLCSWRPSASS